MIIKAKTPPVFDHPQKAAVLAHLTAHADIADCSFDHVRTGLGVDDKALPDGVIHQIAIDAGYSVDI